MPYSDLNDCKEQGRYTYSYGKDNAPANTSILVVYNRNGRIVQMCFPTDVGATSSPYIRNFNNGSWTDWKEISIDIPSFYKSYSDLAALASALEVAQLKTQNDYTNIDSVHGNVNVNVAFTSTETQSAWESPSRYGVLLCRKTGGKYEVQLYFAHGGAGYGAPKMLYRTWSGESWGSWYSVAFQS